MLICLQSHCLHKAHTQSSLHRKIHDLPLFYRTDICNIVGDRSILTLNTHTTPHEAHRPTCQSIKRTQSREMTGKKRALCGHLSAFSTQWQLYIRKWERLGCNTIYVTIKGIICSSFKVVGMIIAELLGDKTKPLLEAQYDSIITWVNMTICQVTSPMNSFCSSLNRWLIWNK